ncbi:hypothetical protein TNCV_2491651 [Trichonephila clavipes]|nr:hypothetical protein TNCV_2491651 [Trichonephila clavipes]
MAVSKICSQKIFDIPFLNGTVITDEEKSHFLLAATLQNNFTDNAALQPFQDGLFPHFDYVSKFLIVTLSLHVPKTNQVAPSPPRTATPSGTIHIYDMGWRLASRVICLATSPSRLFRTGLSSANRIMMDLSVFESTEDSASGQPAFDIVIQALLLVFWYGQSLGTLHESSCPRQR